MLSTGSGLRKIWEHSLVSPQAKAGSTAGIASSLEIACIDGTVRSVLGGMVLRLTQPHFRLPTVTCLLAILFMLFLVDFQVPTGSEHDDHGPGVLGGRSQRPSCRSFTALNAAGANYRLVEPAFPGNWLLVQSNFCHIHCVPLNEGLQPTGRTSPSDFNSIATCRLPNTHSLVATTFQREQTFVEFFKQPPSISVAFPVYRAPPPQPSSRCAKTLFCCFMFQYINWRVEVSRPFIILASSSTS
jgi:hypothetical protein